MLLSYSRKTGNVGLELLVYCFGQVVLENMFLEILCIYLLAQIKFCSNQPDMFTDQTHLKRFSNFTERYYICCSFHARNRKEWSSGLS